MIRLMEMPGGRELRRLTSPLKDSGFLSMAFFPDGKQIAAGVGAEEGPGRNNVMIFDVASGKTVRILNGHHGFVQSLAISPDGKLIASGSGMNDGSAKIWDPSTGKTLQTLSFPLLRKKLKEMGVGIEIIDMMQVDSIAFSPDGKTLATAAGLLLDFQQVDLWDVSTGKLKATLKGVDPYVEHVVFSPDGKLLATVGRSETIKLYNTETFEEASTIKGAKSLAFSPDGKSIAHAKASTERVGGGEIDVVRTVAIRELPISKRR
jgi:WD40 repeat protein